jgi:hypothetical protein
MDTTSKTDDLILDFGSFIKKFYPQYLFDGDNTELIKNLNLWANRDEKFNRKGPGWHIDRGILLFGVPGVGKDVIFRLLRRYLAYLRSPYGYQDRIVWEYAEKFKESGSYNCFNDMRGQNCYYQELARTDEQKAELSLSREMVQHFGNKIIIGVDLINVRYNEFVNYGYQSHFSTNCNDGQLMELYGLRAVDRLKEMCNFMVLPGNSKRGKVAPQFVKNKNVSAPPPARETTIDEHKENKAQLEAQYQEFITNGDLPKMPSITYTLLQSYNCMIAGDEEIRTMMDEFADSYEKPDPSFRGDRVAHRTNYLWVQAKKKAVFNFFESLKLAGAKSIFGIVDVRLDKPVEDIVKQNKSQQ